MQKAIFKWLPEEKIMTLDKTADALNLLRRAGSHKQRNVTYRNKRSYLLAENVKFNLDNVRLFLAYFQILPEGIK